MKRKTVLLFLVFHVMMATLSFAWNDETHLAVARVAGYGKWYSAAGPDIAKIKAGTVESYNHYFNNPENVRVTPDMVLDQAGQYNDPDDQTGHLYGAIIASLRDYIKATFKGRYAEYHLIYCAHYIGDLSNPLHNTPYDEFNKERHAANDGIVELEVLSRISLIKVHMSPVTIRKDHLEDDLAREIARIAENSRRLGYVLRKEKRDMTKEEAYAQLGKSASLFRAILDILGKR